MSMRLYVRTSDRFPFTKEEIQQLALEVVPDSVKNTEDLLITIKDDEKGSSRGAGIDLVTANYPLTEHNYIIALPDPSREKLIKGLTFEEPVHFEYSKEAQEKGYTPLIELESGRDKLAFVLAHEMKHIEQIEKSGTFIPEDPKKSEAEADEYANKVLHEEIRGLKEQG